jgi:hypothetical protein
MSNVYLPELGMVSKATLKVDDELRRYDERLFLKRHPDTGDYCVYIKQPHWSDPPDVVVLGLGPNPPIDWYAVLYKMYEMDTLNHASTMLNAVNEWNEKKRREAKQRADEATMFAAEHLEYAKRREGKSSVVKSVRYRRRW